MPCHTRYVGNATAVVIPKQRTKIDVDQQMVDEYGDVHGHIRTENNRFSVPGDYVIVADLYEQDGTSVLMTERFMYIDEVTTMEEAAELGAYGVMAVDGCSPEEAINLAAQEWMTENYREFVHSHESPQDVFLVGQ